MKNPKVLIPLFVAAAIVTLYLLFKPSGVTNVQAGSVQLPAIPPLEQTTFGLPSGDVMTEAPAAGGGVNHSNVIAASQDPLNMAPLRYWNSNPNAAVNPYGYLTVNEAPWDVYSKAAARQAEYANGIKPHSGGSGSCGCGGGCGGSSSLVKQCGQTWNPRLMDGHGDCLTTKPRFLDGAAIAGNIQYIAASYDDRDYGTHSDFIQSPAGTVIAATAGGI